MAARTLAFIELPRQLGQYCVETGRRLAAGTGVRCLHYSLRTEVRSLLRRCGVAVEPVTTGLPAAAGARLTLDLSLCKLANSGDRRWLGQAAQLQAGLAEYFDRHAVDAIFVWNGSDLTAAVAVALARQRGMTVLFGENGYLPGTLQIDTGGVNCLSSLNAAIAAGEFRGASLPPAERAALEASLVTLRSAARRAPAAAQLRRVQPSRLALAERELLRPLQLSRVSLHPRPREFAASALPADIGPYVLLPLQVLGDSQLIQHSPLIGNDMPSFVRRVAEALQQVAPGTRLVAKLHPMEQVYELGAYRRLSGRVPNLSWVRDVPATRLAAGADAVVTVNSTVGFEALALGRPVVTLGRNFYCHAPLVHPVTQLDALPAALRQALHTPLDLELRDQFLAFVWQRILVETSYRDLSERSLGALVRRLAALLGYGVAQPPGVKTQAATAAH
ncbi:MAG: capsule polysaccharide export protein [Hydrocarboniphaga sp.]|uniref:capsular polysaccharide export protein, LipB/KpsS family n=1 Tax=Hydrocarboniphaga sp. TaxID=2033016 RepID=UPI002607AA52|nr:hypothetical protein [Hydrocarboniphaga sp.]MDB5969466.1 capsule polysaccharide export protein [Hydrocarboniphaga sp.]